MKGITPMVAVLPASNLSVGCASRRHWNQEDPNNQIVEFGRDIAGTPEFNQVLRQQRARDVMRQIAILGSGCFCPG